MSFLRLQYTRSDGEVDTYHLKAGRRYQVGRGSTCEVRILDMRLSRKHCAVECINGSWYVADLGSTNGCKIDKKRIVNSELVEADTTVTLGSVEIYIATITDHLELDSESGSTEQSISDSESQEHTESSDTIAGPSSDEEEYAANDAKDLVDKDSDQDDDYKPTTSKIRIGTVTGEEEETKTVFISALGKKVGPITRTQARELKKREIQGALTEDELEKIINQAE